MISGATVGETRTVDTTKKAKTSFHVPDTLAPQLATLVDRPPSGEWLYEIKFDGYRILTHFSAGQVRLLRRNGNDWTERLPLQAKALAALTCPNAARTGSNSSVVYVRRHLSPCVATSQRVTWSASIFSLHALEAYDALKS